MALASKKIHCSIIPCFFEFTGRCLGCLFPPPARFSEFFCFWGGFPPCFFDCCWCVSGCLKVASFLSSKFLFPSNKPHFSTSSPPASDTQETATNHYSQIVSCWLNHYPSHNHGFSCKMVVSPMIVTFQIPHHFFQ